MRRQERQRGGNIDTAILGSSTNKHHVFTAFLWPTSVLDHHAGALVWRGGVDNHHAEALVRRGGVDNHHAEALVRRGGVDMPNNVQHPLQASLSSSRHPLQASLSSSRDDEASERLLLLFEVPAFAFVTSFPTWQKANAGTSRFLRFRQEAQE